MIETLQWALQGRDLKVRGLSCHYSGRCCEDPSPTETAKPSQQAIKGAFDDLHRAAFHNIVQADII
jgi:hypothetical protein